MTQMGRCEIEDCIAEAIKDRAPRLVSFTFWHIQTIMEMMKDDDRLNVSTLEKVNDAVNKHIGFVSESI